MNFQRSHITTSVMSDVFESLNTKSVSVICSGVNKIAYLPTFENSHGGDCARAVKPTTNGSMRPLRTHTWNSNTYVHDFISTSHHSNHLYILCKRPFAIIHHQSDQNRLCSLYQVITPLENFKCLIPIFLPYRKIQI